MSVSDAHLLPGFLTPVLTLLSFQSHRLLFLHAFSRGERRKYAGKKVRLDRVSNSQPPYHERARERERERERDRREKERRREREREMTNHRPHLSVNKQERCTNR